MSDCNENHSCDDEELVFTKKTQQEYKDEHTKDACENISDSSSDANEFSAHKELFNSTNIFKPMTDSPDK